MSDSFTTIIMAAKPQTPLRYVVASLGPNWPGRKIVVSNGIEIDPKDAIGWDIVKFNKNYGIGSVLNFSTRIANSEWMMILEEDWILHEPPDNSGQWIFDAIACCEKHQLDVLRMRRNRTPSDVENYGCFDWVDSCNLDICCGQILRLRNGGKWLMQNAPSLRRVKTFANLPPFIEHDGKSRYYDAWYTQKSPKEEVAINSFNAKHYPLKIGIVSPGFFIHDLFRSVPDIPLECPVCTFGFLSGSIIDGENWCKRCTKQWPESLLKLTKNPGCA